MSDNLGNIVSGDTLHPLLQLAMASQAVPTAAPIPASAPPQGFFTTSRGDYAPAAFTPPQQAPAPPASTAATRPDIPPLRVASTAQPPPKPAAPAPPPPMPKPVDTRPDLPGQPGAKEPDPSRWGQDNSPLGRMIDRAMKHLEEQPTIRPPDLKDLPPPVSQQVQNNWMATVLSSAGLLLAAFGSRRSAAPMTAAIKSFGGYLEGYNQGQTEVWKQKQEEYKQQLDYALQRNQVELDRYKTAVEASKGDTDKLHEMLYAASILNEDDRGRAQLEQGRITEFFKYQDAKQKWWEDVTAIRKSDALSGLHSQLPPEPELPEDLRSFIYGGGGAGGGGALDIVRRAESSGDWKATGPDTSSGPARGGYQIKDGTWKQYAPANVQRKWPTADQAPPEVQTEVAKTIPINQWAQSTRDKLHQRYGDFDENQTLGQLDRQHPSGGTLVAGPGGGTTGGTTPQPDTSGQIATDDSPAAQLGRQLFRGGEPSPGTDKDKEAYAEAYAENLQKRLDAVIASGVTGPELLKRVREIDAPTAERLQAIAANRQALPASGMSSRLDTLRSTFADLAPRINKDWAPQAYSFRQKVYDAYAPGGYTGQRIQASSRMISTADQVLDAVARVPSGQTLLQNRYLSWYTTQTGAGEYTDLFIAWRGLTEEYTRAMRGGGGAEADIQQPMQVIPIYGSKEQIRGAVQRMMRTVQGQVQGFDDYWHDQDMPGRAPGISEKLQKGFDRYDKMDPKTGGPAGAAFDPNQPVQ